MKALQMKKGMTAVEVEDSGNETPPPELAYSPHVDTEGEEQSSDDDSVSTPPALEAK